MMVYMMCDMSHVRLTPLMPGSLNDYKYAISIALIDFSLCLIVYCAMCAS